MKAYLLNYCFKYKALKEIDASQSCIATEKAYGVVKSTVSLCLERKTRIVKAVEGKYASKKRKA